MGGWFEPIPAPPVPSFVLGCDLGQVQDPSAVVLVEQSGERGGYTYDVRDVQRLPLGTRYPAVVGHVRAAVAMLLSPLPRPKVEVVIDRTGVGRGVGDLFAESDLGCPLTQVTITGADAVTRDADGGWRTPKRDLASVVQVLLQTGRLRIAETLPMARELTKELTGFRVKTTLTGHQTFAAGEDWRSAPHDDLVLALALGVWWGEHRPARWEDLDDRSLARWRAL